MSRIFYRFRVLRSVVFYRFRVFRSVVFFRFRVFRSVVFFRFRVLRSRVFFMFMFLCLEFQVTLHAKMSMPDSTNPYLITHSFKGALVNRTLPSLRRGLLKIRLKSHLRLILIELIQEFELIDRKELAPLQDLIDRLTKAKS